MKDPFEIADEIIGDTYPNFYKRSRGWWGAKRVPNYGILRGNIARVVIELQDRIKE